MADASIELRAILRDEISVGLRGIAAELAKVAEAGKTTGSAVAAGESKAEAATQAAVAAMALQVAELNRTVAAGKDAGAAIASGEAHALNGIRAATESISKQIGELVTVRTVAKEAGAAMASGESQALPTIRSVTDALGQQTAALRAQRDAMKTPEYAHYAAQQKEIREEMAKMTPKVETTSMAWTNLASKYFLVTQAIGPLVRGFEAVFEATKNQDKLVTRLTAIEGSAQGSARAMATLIEVAKLPGLGLTEAASGYASLRALNMEASTSISLIKGLAKANAQMGGGEAEFGRVMNQITQMIGKGKLMSEEIRTISESMPNFRGLMMSAFGTTDTEAIAAKMSVEEFLAGIVAAAEKLPPAGETISNNLDNMGDAWERLKASMGDVQFFKDATRAIAEFMGNGAEEAELEKKAGSIRKEREKMEEGTKGPGTLSGIFDFVRSSSAAEDARLAEKKRIEEWSYNPELAYLREQKPDEVSRGLEGGREENAAGKYAGQSAALTDDQKRLAAETQKQLKKDSESQVKLITEKWDKLLLAEAIGSKAYLEGVKARDIELAAARKKGGGGARKDKTPVMTEYQIDFLDKANDKRVAEAAAYENEKIARKERLDARKKAESDTKQEIADLRKQIAAKNKEIAIGEAAELTAYAKIEAAKSRVLRKELDARKKEYERYSDVVQGFASTEVSKALQGNLTITQFLRDAKDTAISFAVETTTKKIAAWAEERYFAAETAVVAQAEATAALAASVATQAAAAAAVGAAWSTPAILASIGTAGASAVAGEAAFLQAITTAQIASVPMRARGGPVFGDFIAGERGAEGVRPIVPSVVTSSHTTNNGGNTIHIHINGGDQNRILRTIRQASGDRKQTSF